MRSASIPSTQPAQSIARLLQETHRAAAAAMVAYLFRWGLLETSRSLLDIFLQVRRGREGKALRDVGKEENKHTKEYSSKFPLSSIPNSFELGATLEYFERLIGIRFIVLRF